MKKLLLTVRAVGLDDEYYEMLQSLSQVKDIKIVEASVYPNKHLKVSVIIDSSTRIFSHAFSKEINKDCYEEEDYVDDINDIVIFEDEKDISDLNEIVPEVEKLKEFRDLVQEILKTSTIAPYTVQTVLTHEIFEAVAFENIDRKDV